MRECFEEAGVLLAYDERGEVIRLADPDVAARFATYRRAVDRGEQRLIEVCAKERLQLLWQVAEIDEALLEDREHVIGVLRKIAELDPSDLKAHRALEKHYAATNRWSELDRLLAVQNAEPAGTGDETASEVNSTGALRCRQSEQARRGAPVTCRSAPLPACTPPTTSF